ncbi:MAG TPA: PAS domain S-box protein [Calditrichia bacterium]|nr:PAS domain S-box protein [Calditrichota bacterium]HQU71018.1 PAS domain S-box protein [Calditrichia bacterium]HQV30585.1 PAS domain S-box protein [Calditrichia bacterium]
MIDELNDILRLLDRIVGQYPMYFYLVDADNKIRWFNRFMADRLPEIAVGQEAGCGQMQWVCAPDCSDCPVQVFQTPAHEVQKTLVKTLVGEGGEEVFLEFFNFPVYASDGVTSEGVLRVGIDVTENEKLRETLRERQKLYATIINISEDAIIFLDPEDRIQGWNKGAEKLFGYSEEEILGRDVAILVPNELREMGERGNIKKELEKDGALQNFETQRIHRDGHRIHVDISITRVMDENRNYLGSSEIIKDISPRKALEMELLRTIRELSKLNELNDILHGTHHLDEILKYILIGITAGEGLRFNRAFLVLVDQETACLQGSLAIGPSNPNEASQIWDVLNAQNKHLRDIVKSYAIDLEGVDRGVNEIVRKIYVPLHRTDHVLIEALNNRRLLKVENRAFPGSESRQTDVGDQTLFEVLGNDNFVLVPLYSKTEPLGIIIADNVITHREITREDLESLKLFATQASTAIENARLYHDLEMRIVDLQSAYRQLAQNQEKLLQAERLAGIGEMSAKVAHEIRNPLVSIGGFARIIERKVPDDPQIKKFARIIREQVEGLESILNNILNAANPPKPQLQTVNINSVVKRVSNLLADAIERRQATFSHESESEAIWVWGDERLLFQAIFNLVKNALEALEALEEREKNGLITVITRMDGDRVRIDITDNGPGIAQPILKKIFNKFFTTKSSGTGLGLSIVHQIVDAHEGTIGVESPEEGGTRFCLHFPSAPQPDSNPDTVV